MPSSAAHHSSQRCSQCGSVLQAGTGLCPACVGESFFETGSFTLHAIGAEVERVGRYRVIELLGEGGFGMVYRALDEGPLEREVALKVMKPGLDSRQVIERFQAERQALMLLDHPHIARVLDAGETEDGRPFFAMELVEGLPLNEFCYSMQPGLAERLALFLQIGAAVEHAHARGVIHRDLKPSNILITWSGAEGAAKATVIDFGIAKALGSETAPHTGTLGARLVLGTPEYMSPEQAAADGSAVDTRSDVFSLGVLLFELLTGAPPLGTGRLTTLPLDEVLRLIREEEAQRPSRTMIESKSTALERRVADELDWVVLKALAKERDRRYQTARELAEDVRRFLENDTVSARPPTLAYQVAKFFRRHRAAVMAAAAVVLSLAAVAVLALVMAQRENHARLETRRSFSDADTSLAHDRAREGRYAEAVALLCRALRNDPANGAARMRLLSLLAAPACGVPLAEPLHEPAGVDAVEFLPPDGQRVLTRSPAGRALTVWQPQEPSPMMRRFEMADEMTCHAFSADGRLVAAGAKDGQCEIWDTDKGPQSLSGLLQGADGGGAVRDCAFAPDGKTFFAGGERPLARAFDAVTGELRWTCGVPAALTRMAVSPRGDVLAAATEDGRLVLLDAATGALRHEAQVQARPIGWVIFSADGRVVLAGGGGKEAGVMVVAKGQLHAEKISHWTTLRSLALHSSGAWAAHAADDFSVRLCDEQGHTLGLRAMNAPVSRLAFAPVKKGLLLAAGTAGPVSSVSLLAGRDLRRVDAPLQFDGAVNDLRIDGAAQRMLVATGSHRVELLDLRPRRLEPVSLMAGGRLHTAFFTQDGRWIVALAEDGRVLRWDRRSMKPGEPVNAPLRIAVNAASVSSRAGDRLAVLTRMENGSRLTVLDASEPRVRWQKDFEPNWAKVLFHPDGTALTLIDEKGTEMAFAAETGQPLSTAPKRVAEPEVSPRVKGMRFAKLAANGQVAVTSDELHQVTFWHLPRRLPIAADVPEMRYTVAVDATADGAMALAARSAGEIRVWHLPPADGAALPECFLRFAEGFGRWRTGGDRGFEPVPFAVFDSARREVLALPDSDRQTMWMKWLAGDPEERGEMAEGWSVGAMEH
ncbi:MAG: protein kinase [Verrucomicrobiaceae bacterium]|nr:protein kinase [Verrucomicrobiaceae bacterium]